MQVKPGVLATLYGSKISTISVRVTPLYFPFHAITTRRRTYIVFLPLALIISLYFSERIATYVSNVSVTALVTLIANHIALF